MKQCTCQPKRIIDGMKLCGNHAKKAGLKTMLSVSARTVVPMPQLTIAPIEANPTQVLSVSCRAVLCVVFPISFFSKPIKIYVHFVIENHFNQLGGGPNIVGIGMPGFSWLVQVCALVHSSH